VTHTPHDPFATASDVARAIRRREMAPTEVAETYLHRIDQLDGDLGAFCHRADDDVRAAARRAEERLVRAGADEPLPPFLGVPLAIKDLVDVAGWPTTHGSAATSRRPATASDPVVLRVLDAGFVPLGKTTTSEFGTVPFVENEVHGTTRNPWDRTRSPGGSSSGAGVAVAAGMAPIAHAADGGGSIRIPASCTGLVGLKPTRGLVTNGVVEAEGLGLHGVITRSVEDTAAVLDVLAVHDPTAWWSPPDRQQPFTAAMTAGSDGGLRIGLMTRSPIESIEVDPACVTAVERTAGVLELLGHHLVDAELPLPPIDELLGAFTPIWDTAGAGLELEHPERVEPLTRLMREDAREVDSLSYVERVRMAQEISRRIVGGFLAHFDVLVTPTMACLPPPLGTLPASGDDDPRMGLIRSYPMAVFTTLFNVTGQPAISLPLHHDEATDLPVGVQLVAAPWREDRLLQVARSLELAMPWSNRRPAEPPHPRVA
jgi:amidase